jgi:hypothetical protein
LRIGAQVAGALDAVHELGLVHGRLTARAILLEDRPEGEHAFLSGVGTGRPPPAATRGADIAALGAVLLDALEKSAGTLPAEVDPVRERAQARRTGAGYATAGALVEAIGRAWPAGDGPVPGAVGGPVDEAPPGPGRRRATVLAVGCALAAGVAAIVLSVTSGDDDARRPAVSGPAPAVPGGAPRVAGVTRIRLGGKLLTNVVADAERVYVADQDGRAVFVVDAVRRRKIARVSLPGRPWALALDPRRKRLLIGLRDRRVFALDARTNRVRPTAIRPGMLPVDMQVTGNTLMVAQHDPLQIVRFDLARSRQIGKKLNVKGSSLGVIPYRGSFLALFGLSPGFARITPRGHIDEHVIKDGYLPNDVVVIDGRMWVTDFGIAGVLRFDPDTGKRIGARIPTGRNPFALVFDGSSLWVTSRGDGTVTRIDARTGRALAPAIRIGRLNGYLTPRGGNRPGAWVPDTEDLLEVVPPGPGA